MHNSHQNTHLIEEGIFCIRKGFGALRHFVQANPHVQLAGGHSHLGSLVHRDADEKLLRSTCETVVHVTHYLTNSTRKWVTGIVIFKIASKFEWKASATAFQCFE